MKRKLLATLLAVTTVVSMTACGGQAEESKAPAESKTEASAETPADKPVDTQPEASTDPIANLIASTTGEVALRVWASEEDQELTTSLLEGFKATYPEVTFNIELGKESESTCKDTVLADVEAAADVFAFADDQVNELVKAGALMPVAATYTYDVASANAAGSVEAATVDGTLYAYPMTADNGYFMFYDASVFAESDLASFDTMIAAAEKAGKKIAMDISNGWYIYSFFQGAGYGVGLNADGLTNYCDWNKDGAGNVAQAIMDLCATGVLVDLSDEETATAIAEGTVCAAVNGTWRAETAATAWGENYAACKLPTFNVAGKECQMSSYSGYKLIGVNKYSANPGWAMLLAEYLTSEASQIARFEARGLGPANIVAASSDKVASNPAIAALAEQAAFATPQRVGGNFWSPAETLGGILAQGNPDGKDVQALLDECVTGITAPVQ